MRSPRNECACLPPLEPPAIKQKDLDIVYIYIYFACGNSKPSCKNWISVISLWRNLESRCATKRIGKTSYKATQRSSRSFQQGQKRGIGTCPKRPCHPSNHVSSRRVGKSKLSLSSKLSWTPRECSMHFNRSRETWRYYWRCHGTQHMESEFDMHMKRLSSSTKACHQRVWRHTI